MSESTISKVVIVGSGQAGVECAAALRHSGFAGAVTIIGDEPDLPYQRPPLSKEFLKSPADSSLPLKGEAFYGQNDIEVRLGGFVRRIDREAREVELASGDKIAYDHLVLATGARNRFPPVEGLDPSLVLELRTLAHARALTARLEALKHVTIIGGGFIGLEVAALLRQRDIAVDVLEAADRLMGRVLSPMMSEEFRKIHEEIGTRLRLGAVATQISGGTVSLSDGETIETDAVIVAAGILPNVELAQDAGLAIENGIVVDANLVTSDPAISAIGDCAAHPNPWGLGMIRLESVQNAVDQGKCVAARLTGTPAAYDALPWFWSHQGKAKLQIAGLAMGMDETVMRGDPADGKFSVFVYRQGRLIAVESLNSPADHMVARRMLAAGLSIPRDVASDPAVDLKTLIPRPAA
ncbi:FAD-dependent oxidoreductase [Mesorhizobium sp. CAU 1741]|uniref:NAD(P)/FAD-dependent oxidoreductase n=1 Tax=Mesorhizobium sp. CAU 1741 TaxID=3140366 RepID=UPI00325BC624